MRLAPTLACLAIATSATTRAEAQARGALRGTVTDASGEPIAGATVIAGAAEATTDDAGRYEIADVEAGAVDLVVIADGFEVGLRTVRVGRGRATADLVLAASAGGSEVIEIVDRAPVEAEPATYELSGDDVRTLPGSGNDALKALQSLPGVSRVPFGLAGLALRGTSPRDSSVYLDGIEVPILYHFGGLASFYPSALLDDIDLQPGTFGAAWGRSQGGIVLLTSRAGRGDRWRVASEASLIDASLRAEGPAPGGGAWSMGLRRSYIDAVLAAALPDGAGALTLTPRYWDGQLRYDRGTPATGQLTGMMFFSDDLLRFTGEQEAGEDDRDQLRYVSRFVRAGARYLRRFDHTELRVTPWLGWSEVAVEVDDQRVARDYFPMGARVEATRYLGVHEVSAGIDAQGGRSALGLRNEPAPGPGMMTTADENIVSRSRAVWDADVGAWIQAALRVGPSVIEPGVRAERYGLSDEWVVDPRIAYAQRLSDRLTFRAAAGIYHQPPQFADVDPVYGNQELESSWSRQLSLGAEVALPGDASVGVTTYATEVEDLPVDVVTGASAAADGGTARSGGVASISRELTDDQFGSYEYRENVGRGRSHGVELLARRAGETWAGWISYAYARSYRTDDPARFVGWRPYVLDQPHVLTAVGTVRLGAWQLGARVRYASGNPYTPVAGTYYDVDQQAYAPVDGEPLSVRLPAYAAIDVRVDRAWRRPWGTVKLFLDVQNATNRVNPEGVTYNHDYTEPQYTRGLPVFPSIGVEYLP